MLAVSPSLGAVEDDVWLNALIDDSERVPSQEDPAIPDAGEGTIHAEAVIPVGGLPEAAAPSPGPAPRQRIEEIVVSAQRRAQNIQDVPIALSAISAGEIRDRQIISLADIAGQMSGFHFGEVAGGGQASIRGVGFSLVSGVGEGSVAIHTDGLFLSRPGQSTMLQHGLAGIEVLRGPQGTLYGRNATAGVVNMVSPAPPEQFEAGLSALAGNFDRYKLSGHAGTGLLDGALRLRLSGVFDHRGDHLINEAFPGRDQGGVEQLGLRLNADLAATDRLHFELRAFHVDEDFNGPLYAAYKPEPNALLAPRGTWSEHPYRIRTNDAGDSNKRMSGGSLRAVFDITDRLRLTSLTGYVDYDFTTIGYDGDGTSNDVFTAFRYDNSQTFTQELLLNWQSPRWQWLVGLYHLEEDYTLTNDILVSVSGLGTVVLANVLPGLDPELLAQLLGPLDRDVNIHNASEEDTSSSAAFFDTTYSFTDRLRGFAGARYIRDRKKHLLTSRIFPVDVPAVGLTSCRDLQSRMAFDQLTGRAGLQYDLAREMMIYAQYSTGYKSGGFAIGACNDRFEPEELSAYEVGLKSTWFDQQLRFNSALFWYDYENLQVEQVNIPTVVVNNAEAEIKGAEFELTALPLEGLQIALNGTWLDARYTEYFNSDNTASVLGGPEQDLSGNRLNRSPTFAGGLSLQYEWAMAGGMRVHLRGEANYATRTWLREFNNPTDFQKAHGMYNAYLSWFSPRSTWTLHGFVKNISDEPVLAGFLGIAGYKTASFNLPRTFGVELGYRFR